MIRTWLYLLISFLTIESAFRLAARGQAEEARRFLTRRYFHAVIRKPFSVLAIEYVLLRAYLDMKTRRRAYPGRIFTQIWQSKKISYAEKNFLSRYALTVLWFERGCSGECLLRIRGSLEIAPESVRYDFRRKFSSPDVDEGRDLSITEFQ